MISYLIWCCLSKTLENCVVVFSISCISVLELHQSCPTDWLNDRFYLYQSFVAEFFEFNVCTFLLESAFIRPRIVLRSRFGSIKALSVGKGDQFSTTFTLKHCIYYQKSFCQKLNVQTQHRIDLVSHSCIYIVFENIAMICNTEYNQIILSTPRFYTSP